MPLGLIRTIAALLGILLALTTVIMLPFWLIQQSWWYLGEWLGWQYPAADLPPWPVLEYPPFSLAGQVMPAPPTTVAFLEYAVMILLGAVSLISVLTLFLPLRHRIKTVCGHAGYPLGEHPHQCFVDGLCTRYNIGGIQVRRFPIEGIAAFALSTPGNRHAIVISDGLLSQPDAVVKWVLAHEVAHIHFGDTHSTTLWLTAFKSINLFSRLRIMLMNLILRLIAFLPVLRLVTFPTYWLFRGLVVVGRIGRWLGRLIFLVADRWVSRRMEYRADLFAVETVGASPGLFLFEHLVGHFEPSFDLLATHPPHDKRYEAIQNSAYIKGQNA